MKRHSRPFATALAMLAILAACANDNMIKDTRQMMSEGRADEALATLTKAIQDDPRNGAIRQEFFRQRDYAISQWLVRAENVRSAGQPDAADDLYKRVLKYDPGNARAIQGLAQTEVDRRHRLLIAEAERAVKAERYRDARDALAAVLTENPSQRDARALMRVIDEKTTKPAVAMLQLRSSVAKPVSLELKDVPLRTVFDVIARAGNLNFLFDKDVRADQRTTLVVRDAQVEDVIKLILATNQLEQKVLNETTALIYPNTPQKLREYQDLVVKSFYLVNADVKQTANLIRTILKTRDIFVDEKINLLVMKDTPNAIRLAEKLIAAQDIADPEVMLQVEVLEIGYNKLLEVGAQISPTAAAGVVGAAGVPGQLTLSELQSRDKNLVRLTFADPLFLLTLHQTDGRTNLLANPQIRVRNKEKAKIHIGDRVPVLTTTAAAAGTFVSQSVTYLDVGLKLEVEPLVYIDDDVGIKLSLEVSSITNTIQTPSGTGTTLVYQVGTRNTTTVLRLHDGETQVLAGLISDEDRRSAVRVPGIGEIPALGRLFSSTSDNTVKTEIVLLITPRLLRTMQRADARTVEFAAGTEASSSGGPLGGGSVPPFTQQIAPQFQQAPQAAPAYVPNVPVPTTGGTQVPFGGVQPGQ
jgi:general secretion pathway protein D